MGVVDWLAAACALPCGMAVGSFQQLPPPAHLEQTNAWAIIRSTPPTLSSRATQPAARVGLKQPTQPSTAARAGRIVPRTSARVVVGLAKPAQALDRGDCHIFELRRLASAATRTRHGVVLDGNEPGNTSRPAHSCQPLIQQRTGLNSSTTPPSHSQLAVDVQVPVDVSSAAPWVVQAAVRCRHATHMPSRLDHPGPAPAVHCERVLHERNAMADANAAVPDVHGNFWQFYGNKKLSDVDILLAEEHPAAEEPAAPAAVAGAADVASGSQLEQDEGDPAAATAAAADGAEAAAGGVIAVLGAPAAAASDNKDGGLQNEGGPAAETARSKRKRQEGEHIFGHSVVLAAFSDYCRTKLLDWDDAADTTEQQAGSGSSRARHEIQLLVPAGQLEVGRLLIRGMYQQQPDLSGVSQAQLIQLLLLADRFEVPKVQAAVSAAFRALPPERLQWDTVMAVYSLPAGCAELAACQDLFSAVAAKVQHELGDLELALTDPESSKARQLLGLPFGALKQLLQDKRTRVASENTVVYAIQQWHIRQQQQIEASNRPQQQQQLESLQQQAQELLRLVRMPHCSQLFIATVVAQCKLANSMFSHHELLLASSYARSAIGQRKLPRDAASLPGFQRYPAWRLPARRPSAMKQLTINWKLPLEQLSDGFEEHLECSAGVGGTTGKERFWQALYVYPRVEFSRTSSSGQSGPIRHLGFICYAGLWSGECRSVSIAFKAHSFLRGAAGSKFNSSYQFTNYYDNWGPSEFVELGAVDSWEDAEVVLRNKGLVGDDGCLHLTMAVLNVD